MKRKRTFFTITYWGGGDKKHNMQKEEGFEKNETGKRFFIHKKMKGFAH